MKTVEFLSGADPRMPALASGAGGTRDLKERLTMIMKHRIPRSLTRGQAWLLTLCIAALLLFFPTWADRGSVGCGPKRLLGFG